MAGLIPPNPVGVVPGSGLWNDWIEKIRFAVNTTLGGITFASLLGKPTTLAGYGITDAQTKLNDSAGLAAALSDETGTGVAVFNTSPTLITPTLGAATASSLVVDTTTLVVDSVNDRVGVGTAAPVRKLSMSGAGDTRFTITDTAIPRTYNISISHGAVGAGYLTIGVEGVATYATMDSSGNWRFGTNVAPSGTYKLEVDGTLSVSSTTMIRSATSFTNGAGASAGTLGNAPAAGNPTKWVPINDNGTTRYIPTW